MSKLYRMFRSILNLRQVLQSATQWLLLMDKKKYYNDQSKPFLLMVATQTTSSLKQFTAIFQCVYMMVMFSGFTNVSADLCLRTMRLQLRMLCL